MDVASTTSIESASSVGYTDAVAYIAVATELFDTVKREGYQVKFREFVPCSFSVKDALDGFIRRHENVDDVSVLEVRNLPETMLDRDKGRIRAKHLTSKHLFDGHVAIRHSEDYDEAPCPLCGGKLSTELAIARGRVGVYRFFKRAYVVSPCPKCMEDGTLLRREERLNGGETLRLYHQTSEAFARQIRATGKMRRGSNGIAGAAMYFAKTPRETEWKALQKGVVLECEVRLGNSKPTDRDPPKETTFASLSQEGFDSLTVNRGVNKAIGKHSGFEYVVYSWDQVSVLGEVPRDPVPAQA